MTYRIPLLTSLISTGLLFTGIAWAQPQPAQLTSPSTQSQPMQSANPSQGNTASPMAGTDSMTFNSPQGQVTVRSIMGQTPSTASPPSFDQLSGGTKFITMSQANAYPPLANDFGYAADHGNRISKAQYQHWLKDLN
ncbi:MAG TPA: hypothetical protein VME63_02085 [Dyella sp.]|uniref:hypothetical protein n=1 Tax=Dyella sp. TaxID=1869338 RepID=UPI002CB9F8DA|nr:hypothetical protein [Dyella sp.]HTV84162.1 hypothetical protein [Dyella sp.]